MKAKLNPKALRILEELSLQTGTSPQDLVSQAWVLLATAVQTRLKGGKVYLAPSGSALVEVGGLLMQESGPISLETVTRFAEEAHGDQKYGELPYLKHLSDVVQVLGRFGYKRTGEFLDPHVRADRLVAAAWLHDVLEDTDVSYEELRDLFGCEIAYLVGNVTSAKGKNRQERNKLTYPKVRRSVEAVILKLADRIANVESCRETDNSLLKTYKKEWPSFRKALYRPQECEEMWTVLKQLLDEK